jgi:two-component system LytT family response regulator
MLRVALIDDERLARKGLKQLLADYSDVQVVGEADNHRDALEMLRREKPDAVFLDIRMPGADGFDVLRDLNPPPKVVFVTAHSEHAAEAFEVAAVDYLLKPVKPERFLMAVQRIREACRGRVRRDEGVEYAVTDRICLRTPQRTVIAPVSSLCLLEADGDFTRIFIREAPAIMICQPLRIYEKMLPSPPFVRIDRSLIVNIEQIARSERKSRNEAVLILKGIPMTVPLGRTAQARLREHLP